MNPLTSFVRRFALLPLLLAALALAVLPGCEDEQLVEPDDAGQGALFNRYVALGNSITAGYQSDGINANTQLDAYPVLLADKMGTRENFDVPLLQNPGCPPPLVQIFPEQERLAPGVECALRQPNAPSTINNVAVPGAEVVDVLDNFAGDGNANALTTFILGARTQLEAALDANPTFASVWIGNNDVLGAALAGNPALITDADAFEERYTQMLDGLEDGAENLQGGLLFAVSDVTAIPALSPGAAYFQAIPQAQQAGALPPNLEVANTCVPSASGGVGDQMLVPFQHGATLFQVATSLAEQMGQNAPTITLDCAQDRTVRETVGAAFGGMENIPPAVDEAIAGTAGISILTQAEIGQLAQAVQNFNAFIETQAGERDYTYLNVNTLFEANADQIPVFPELIDDPTNDFSSEEPFGPLFSLDGVHPSGQAHRLIAEAAAQAINQTYDTSLPTSSEN